MVQVGDSCGRWGVEDGWIDGEKVRDDGCAVGYPAVENAVTSRAYPAAHRDDSGRYHDRVKDVYLSDLAVGCDSTMARNLCTRRDCVDY